MQTAFGNMKLAIKAIPPFNFEISALIFSEGDKQIRKYENGKFWQVIRVNGKLVLIVIKPMGSLDRPRLSIELVSDRELSDNDGKKAAEIVHSFFNLDFDLKPFYDDVKNDVVMARLTRELCGLRSPTTASVFEALVDSIIEQQISLNVAHGLEVRVIKAFGDRLKVNGEVYYAYPTPQRLASAPVEQLRMCGLSMRKAEYIKNASELVTGGRLNLERFKDYDDMNAIVRELDDVKGVGVWTAELTMVRGMRKLDALPADDLGLRRVISHYYCNDRKISSDEARRIAEKWGSWKGLASFYLIVAESRGLSVV
jgi:DNA-3-methyladenine glycosylase II